MAILALVASPTASQDGSRRPNVWDLRLGLHANTLPDGFVDHACGTNGGPPSRPLAGFSEFPACPADRNGLHEVAFRYDDEAEYLARALEQEDLIRLHQGTQLYGYPVIVSALFAADGRLKGIRIVTDPRAADTRPRHEFWSLGTILRQRHYGADWICTQLPMEHGEHPVGRYFVKDDCTAEIDGNRVTVKRRYLQKPGQTFTNADGLVEPGAYDSSTRFEMYAADVALTGTIPSEGDGNP